MVKRITVIKVPQGAVQKMSAAYAVTETMVYNALAGRTNSATAQKIRKDALEVYGGANETRVLF